MRNVAFILKIKIVDNAGLKYKSLVSKPNMKKESISLSGQQRAQQSPRKGISRTKRKMKSSKIKNSIKRKKKDFD